MLLLLFQIGDERYALDARSIVEVLPLVEARPIPLAPAGVAGMFDYRGTLAPMVDTAALVHGRPATQRLSTRVVVVEFPDGTSGTRPLGLIVEKAIRTVRREPSDFADCGVTNERAPYLGPVMRDADGLVQWVDASQLLPASVRDVLFKQRVDQSWQAPTSKAS